MPTGTARTADDITESIRTLVDRLADAKLTQELAKRGHDVAEEVGTFADEAWRESKPMRRDARKRLQRAVVDASKWSDRTWRKTVRPALKDLWKQRTVAMSAAGAAVPAAGAVIDDAAVRLGVKRERRHWGAFFLGLLVGAAVGAIAALLTAPKRGSEIRDELGSRAEELATKAKDEWVPIFERATNGAGEILGEPAIETSAEDATATVQEAAADAGETVGDVGDVGEQAAAETAEAINDAYDAADRESPA
jgi:gas vesicle protein